jgi:hypothetical protein
MENSEHIKKITPYRDINDVLFFLAIGIKDIFGQDLIGFYLTGSLSYGDFVEGRSDIDLAVVLKKPMAPDNLESVKRLHLDAERRHGKWAKRIECSYIPLVMLQNTLPPKDPRPYMGAGIFYPAAPYGNEWLINNYFLYKYGIALIGPDFKALAKPVEIADVQKACVNDLHKEWEPKITDPAFLADSHQQSYVVLNLCRILYAVRRGEAVSKKTAAAWAAKEYPQWESLIKTADNWHYGVKMERLVETIDFIKFILKKAGEKG